MKKLPAQKEGSKGKDGALAVLHANVRALADLHPEIRGDRAKFREAIKIGDGTAGKIFGGRGNPTLKVIEKIATFFHLDVWELFFPGLDVEKVIGEPLTADEKKLHKSIEASMKKLGLVEYKIKKETKQKPQKLK